MERFGRKRTAFEEKRALLMRRELWNESEENLGKGLIISATLGEKCDRLEAQSDRKNHALNLPADKGTQADTPAAADGSG